MTDTIPYLGLEKSLGTQNRTTYTYEVEIFQNQYGNDGGTISLGTVEVRATFDPATGEFTSVQDYQTASTSRAGIQEGLDTLSAGFNGSAHSLCPLNTEYRGDGPFGGYYTAQCDLKEVDNNDTGVYEYLGMMTAIAGLAILLAIISRGIWLAKKAARAMTEETNADDRLEYYEDAAGNVRWRIKPARYYG